MKLKFLCKCSDYPLHYEHVLFTEMCIKLTQTLNFTISTNKKYDQISHIHTHIHTNQFSTSIECLVALLINKVSDIIIEKVQSPDVLDQVRFCVVLNKGLCLIFYTKPIKFSTDTLSLLNTKAPSAYSFLSTTHSTGGGGAYDINSVNTGGGETDPGCW